MKTITREELDVVLAQHKLWLDSDKKEGSRAYLSNANLEGANFNTAQIDKHTRF